MLPGVPPLLVDLVPALAEPWRRDALCIEYPHLPWSLPRGVNPDALDEAKAVCGRCLVRDECLDYALRAGEQYGLWGGLSSKGRHELRRRAA